MYKLLNTFIFSLVCFILWATYLFFTSFNLIFTTEDMTIAFHSVVEPFCVYKTTTFTVVYHKSFHWIMSTHLSLKYKIN